MSCWGEEEREEGSWPAAICEALSLIALGPKKQWAELYLSDFPHSSLGTAQRFRWGLQLSLRDKRASTMPSSTSKVALESANMQTSRSPSPQHCD